jgi:hypothetical protein
MAFLMFKTALNDACKIRRTAEEGIDEDQTLAAKGVRHLRSDRF